MRLHINGHVVPENELETGILTSIVSRHLRDREWSWRDHDDRACRVSRDHDAPEADGYFPVLINAEMDPVPARIADYPRPTPGRAAVDPQGRVVVTYAPPARFGVGDVSLAWYDSPAATAPETP